MASKQRDVRTRLRELEATVAGLTEELVEANERIRHLETALDEGEPRRDEPGVRAEPDEETDTKQMGSAEEGTDETASDLDDIIVA